MSVPLMKTRSLEKAACFLLSCMFLAVTVFSACTRQKDNTVKVTPPSESSMTPGCETLDKLPDDLVKTFEVDYGDKIKLLGVTFVKNSPTRIKLSCYWQPVGEPGIYNKVYVHFAGSDDAILFQADHDFCMKKPFSELQGKLLKETFYADIPQSAMGKEASIKIGIFAPSTTNYERLPIISATGAERKDDNTSAVVGKLRF